MSRHDPITHGDLISAADPTGREQSQAWTFYELAYLRREAQAEAELPYDVWSQLPGADGYAVYRAAQDRADAAQDQLAAWLRGTPTGLAFELSIEGTATRGHLA
jgi:hypothetical protein